MQILYELTPKALDDLDEIWFYIAQDDPKAADRVESAIVAACRRLSKFPWTRQDKDRIDSEIAEILDNSQVSQLLNHLPAREQPPADSRNSARKPGYRTDYSLSTLTLRENHLQLSAN